MKRQKHTGMMYLSMVPLPIDRRVESRARHITIITCSLLVVLGSEKPRVPCTPCSILSSTYLENRGHFKEPGVRWLDIRVWRPIDSISLAEKRHGQHLSQS